jgi:hypothetical protein
MLDNPDGWRGSIAMLGAELHRRDGGRAVRSRAWSWDLKDLSASIDDLASVLFRNGLRVARSRSGNQRQVVLSWISDSRPNGADDTPSHLAQVDRGGAAAVAWRPKP